ncbi:MAG: hypothetical protein ABJA74_11495 [Lapillicoccus sp.]
MSEPAKRSMRRWPRLAPEDVVDVFVYVVVLNLAVQYVPSVFTETFTVSLLTALLLKVVLEAASRAGSGPRPRSWGRSSPASSP